MLEIKERNNQPHSSHPLKKTGGLSVVDMVKNQREERYKWYSSIFSKREYQIPFQLHPSRGILSLG